MTYADTEIKNIVAELSGIEALNIVALFLAQSEERSKPNEELGYDSRSSCLEEIARIFNRKATL
jgi:hypothetical protein